MTDQILKRDGSIEKFDKAKIQRIASASGLSEEDTNSITNKVSTMVTKSVTPVSSLKIRLLILSEMIKVDEYAAGLYEWYEKNKDRNDSLK